MPPNPPLCDPSPSPGPRLRHPSLGQLRPAAPMEMPMATKQPLPHRILGRPTFPPTGAPLPPLLVASPCEIHDGYSPQVVVLVPHPDDHDLHIPSSLSVPAP
ncbi:hypothetical protein VPH35_120876 [Triticum aestivum]